MEGKYELYIEGRRVKILISNRATVISAFDHKGSRVDLTASEYFLALTHTLVLELFRVNGLPIGEYPEVYRQSVYRITEIVKGISELEKVVSKEPLTLPENWSSMNPEDFSGLLHKLLDESS